MKIVTAGLLMGAVLGGCASSDSDAVSNTEAESELGRGGAATLKSRDGNLSIKLEMLDGAQASTRKNRYTKATFTRAGDSFALFCDAITTVAAGSDARAEIRCNESTGGEDSDHLDVIIHRRGRALEAEITASEPFGTHWQTAAGEAFRWVYGGPSKTIALSGASGRNVDKNPLALLDRVEGAMTEALGRKVHVVGDGIDAHLKIWTITGHVSNDMNVGLSPYFGSSDSNVNVDPNDYLAEDVSLLTNAGSPASGVVSKAKLQQRIETALKLE